VSRSRCAKLWESTPDLYKNLFDNGSSSSFTERNDLFNGDCVAISAYLHDKRILFVGASVVCMMCVSSVMGAMVCNCDLGRIISSFIRRIGGSCATIFAHLRDKRALFIGTGIACVSMCDSFLLFLICNVGSGSDTLSSVGDSFRICCTIDK